MLVLAQTVSLLLAGRDGEGRQTLLELSTIDLAQAPTIKASVKSSDSVYLPRPSVKRSVLAVVLQREG
jgi:hypothetical protein